MAILYKILNIIIMIEEIELKNVEYHSALTPFISTVRRHEINSNFMLPSYFLDRDNPVTDKDLAVVSMNTGIIIEFILRIVQQRGCCVSSHCDCLKHILISKEDFKIFKDKHLPEGFTPSVELFNRNYLNFIEMLLEQIVKSLHNENIFLYEEHKLRKLILGCITNNLDNFSVITLLLKGTFCSN
jgi:hypothetical protein